MGLPQAFVELMFDLMDDIAGIGNWLRKNPIAGLGVLFLITFFGLFAQRWFAESEIFSAGFWERDPEGIRNLIWALATVFAGAAGLYGLLLAGRRTAALDRQAQIAHEHRVLAEQGQITERFTKAVEQLGHPEVAVRLGAIYALERIAKDSERDFVTIMETLAAFVREKAPWLPSRSPLQEVEDKIVQDSLSDENARTSIDVFAAVVVLARSVPGNSLLRRGADQHRVDLRNVDLRRIDLPNANLSGFRFDGSNFQHANLYNCNFQDAYVDGALLQNTRCIRADFSGASLEASFFDGASLLGARFVNSNAGYAKMRSVRAYRAAFDNADMYGAQFDQSSMEHATFVRAVLSEASFVNTQLSKAVFDEADISASDFMGARSISRTQFLKAEYLPAEKPRNLPPDIESGLPACG